MKSRKRGIRTVRLRKHPREPLERRERNRIPLIGRLLMLIGLLTVLYLLITYVLMPILALLTVS